MENDELAIALRAIGEAIASLKLTIDTQTAALIMMLGATRNVPMSNEADMKLYLTREKADVLMASSQRTLKELSSVRQSC